MTVKDDTNDGAFTGLMKSLNIDSSQLKPYNTNFAELSLQELSEVKIVIESQLNLLFDLLKHYYNADIDTQLLTKEGFPRNDIDVVGIRLVRVKIIRLRNEHRQVLTLLHDRLESHFASSVSKDEISEHTLNLQQERQQVRGSIPFALVKEVIKDGPSYNASLKEGDRIISIDDINVTNHEKFTKLPLKVRENIDKRIEVVVLRGTTELQLTLIPTTNWGGQGLLGCKIVPL